MYRSFSQIKLLVEKPSAKHDTNFLHLLKIAINPPMQVKYKRLKLLQHPLVEEFLFQRFWLVAIPFFLLYLLFYTSLLIVLTSFTVVSPRPGPDSETCKSLELSYADSCHSQLGTQAYAVKKLATLSNISHFFMCTGSEQKSKHNH